MSYQPEPTAPVPTGMDTVVPRRNPSVVGVKDAFDSAFGGYVPADWTLDAECTAPGVDPRIFFPSKGGRRSPETDQALEVCSRCVVRRECLDDVLVFEVGEIGPSDVRPDVHGIRGGLGVADRRKLVQKIRVERMAEVRTKVLAAYVAGEGIDKIAKRFNISPSTPGRWAKEANLPTRGNNAGGRKKEGTA